MDGPHRPARSRQGRVESAGGQAVTLKVGDKVVFDDAWFRNRGLPVVPIEERMVHEVLAANDWRAAIRATLPDEQGRYWTQIVGVDWLNVIDEQMREADAASSPP